MKKLALVLLAASALGAAEARAAVFTVGPAGTFRWIGEGLAAALASPGTGTHEIRIQQGFYKERLALPSGCCGGRTLLVSGGWNAAFSAKLVDPTRTVVDAMGGGRVLDIPSMTNGAVGLDNLTLRNGRLRATWGEVAKGAGIRALLGGAALLALTGVQVRLNTIEAYADVPRQPGAYTPRGSGAGMDVELRGSSVLQVDRAEFLQNSIKRLGDTPLSARGAGLNVHGEGATAGGTTGGTASVRNSRFTENSIAAGSLDGSGEALYGSTGSRARLKVEDTTFEANGLVSRNVSTVSLNSTGYVATTAYAIDLFRCRFLGNGSEWQLDTSSIGDYSFIRVADNLVANGLGGGVRATSGGGRLYLTNLTVTDHPGMGVRTLPYAFIGVFNNLVWNNHGGELVGMYTSGIANLVGVDPLFVDPAAGDYTLSLASPAIDEGDNSQRSGLGPVDLAGNPRVANGRVDIGAFERAQ